MTFAVLIASRCSRPSRRTLHSGMWEELLAPFRTQRRQGSLANPTTAVATGEHRLTPRLVLKDPSFAQLRFHRVVDIGRCSKCCFLRYKCTSAASGTTERQEWQRLAAAHQNLQLAQKKAPPSLTPSAPRLWRGVPLAVGQRVP